MSFVIAAPEMMTAAALDLAGIGSILSEAHTAAAASTVALVPAAADEVSAGVAHLFSRYAEDFQGLAGRAAAFHEQFAQHLHTGAGSYAGAEAANVASLQPPTATVGSVFNTINSAFTNFLANVTEYVQILQMANVTEYVALLQVLLSLLSHPSGLVLIAFELIYDFHNGSFLN